MWTLSTGLYVIAAVSNRLRETGYVWAGREDSETQDLLLL